MLPSRGISRSLASANAQRHCLSQRVPTRTFGNGRQLSTIRRTLGNGLSPSAAANITTRSSTATIALGGIVSTRAFSLWGYGKKPTPPAADEIASAATATPPSENVVPDKAIESAAAADATTPSTVTETISDAAHSLAEKSPIDLSAITDIVEGASASEILSRPEGIGYLKSLGLEYGWGFTSTMQWVIEHVHIWTGVGWGGSIILTAVLFRAAMFYPQIRSTKFAAKMKRLQEDPRQAEVTEKMKKALQTNDKLLMQQSRLLGNVLRQEYNVPVTGMLWGFLPIPFSFGLFRILNGMTHLPVPALESAGWLWFQDLTLADPYYLLPCMTTAVMVLTMQMNMSNSTEAQKKTMGKIKWVLGPIMLIGTSFLSAAVNVMGLTFAISTAAVQALLNVNSVRKLFGIPLNEVKASPEPAPLPTTLAYEAPRKPQSIREKLEEGVGDMRQGIQDSMTKMTGRVQGTAEEQAAKNRRELIQKLEEKRARQEREHFEQKYKSKGKK